MPTVARLRTLRASTSEAFVVRGVVPVPSDVVLTWPRGGASPLRIVDRDGTPVPTQCERVGATAGDRIRSVEVAARVQPAGSETAQYELAYDPEPGAESSAKPGDVAQPGAAARELLDEGLVLYAHDADETLHTARIRRDACGQCDREGEVLCTRMDQGSLRVADTDGGARRRALLGFNAWLTWSAGSDILLLDLFVHNAHTGRGRAAEVYFRELGLLLTDGWTWENLWPMPSIEAPHLVRARPEGTHVVQPRGGLVFRLVLFRDADRARARRVRRGEGWAVCVPDESLWSWHSAKCGFGPHQLPLPQLDVMKERELLDDPRPWDIVTAAMGAGGGSQGPWKTYGAHPESPYLAWGAFQGGMTSGTEIHACEGAKLAWSGAPDQLSAWFAAQKMYTDRCPVWLIDASTGMPVRDHLTTDREPNWTMGATVEFTRGLEAWGFSARMRGVKEDRLPDGAPEYMTTLSRYGTIDFAHYTRVTSKFLIPALLDNDPLSKFGVRMFGELAFMFAHRRIREFAQEARESPGRGGFLTRISGWSFHAMGAAAHVGDEQQRARMQPFVQLLHDGLEQAIMANGHIHAQTAGRLGNEFGGRYAVNNGIALGIGPNGEAALAQAVASGAVLDGMRDLVVRQAVGMRELRWVPGQAGIITRIGVWEKPDGKPFRDLAQLPEDARSGKESNFYSAILLGLALWFAPRNATLLRAFNDLVGGDARAFFADRRNHSGLGSLGWLWSWWQHHGG